MELVESKWYKKNGANITSIEEVEKCLNIPLPEHDYAIQKYLQKEYLAFGMDGDIGYVFHLLDNSIYRVDLGDLDIASIKHIAPSFDDFLGKAIYLNFDKLQNVANE